MKISTNSMFYRFLSENFVTEEWWIPHNLCPFMRKILLGILATAFVYSLITFAVVSLVFFPLGLIVGFDMWGELWLPFVTFGGLLWILASGIALIWLFAKAEKRFQVVHTASNKVAGLNSVQTSVSWIKAMHDKVCPTITFVED